MCLWKTIFFQKQISADTKNCLDDSYLNIVPDIWMETSKQTT